MLNNSESDLYLAIGCFSTLAQVSVTSDSLNAGGYVSDSYSLAHNGTMSSQCVALLTSSYVFTLFIESWDINRESEDPIFVNKKIYPAKVTGLSIPYPQTQTFKWKEGLIENNFNESQEEYRSYFRPGFGEVILSDLERPSVSTTVVKNTLGLGDLANIGNPVFAGPLGRLMSMAFWVDPVEATKYDASNSKKKKKSLNSQDYEQTPTYPPYTPYDDPSGY